MRLFIEMEFMKKYFLIIIILLTINFINGVITRQPYIKSEKKGLAVVTDIPKEQAVLEEKVISKVQPVSSSIDTRRASYIRSEKKGLAVVPEIQVVVDNAARDAVMLSQYNLIKQIMFKSEEIEQIAHQKFIENIWFKEGVIKKNSIDNQYSIQSEFKDVRFSEKEIIESSLWDFMKGHYRGLTQLKSFRDIASNLSILFSSRDNKLAVVRMFNLLNTEESYETLLRKEKEFTLKYTEQKHYQFLQKTKVFQRVFNYTGAGAADAPPIILLAVHGTISNSDSYGKNANKPLSKAIFNFCKELAHVKKNSVELWSINWSGAYEPSGSYENAERNIVGWYLSILINILKNKINIKEVWSIAHSHGCNVINSLVAGLGKNHPQVYSIHIASPLSTIDIKKFINKFSDLYHFIGSADKVVELDAFARISKFKPELFGKLYDCTIINKGQGVGHKDIKPLVIEQLPLILYSLSVYKFHNNLLINMFDYYKDNFIMPTIIISPNHQLIGYKGREVVDEKQVGFEIGYSNKEKERFKQKYPKSKIYT